PPQEPLELNACPYAQPSMPAAPALRADARREIRGDRRAAVHGCAARAGRRVQGDVLERHRWREQVVLGQLWEGRSVRRSILVQAKARPTLKVPGFFVGCLRPKPRNVTTKRHTK